MEEFFMKLKKISAFGVCLALVASMTACNTEESGSSDVWTTTAAEAEETYYTEETTEDVYDEPPVDTDVPAGKEFKYYFDEELNGICITEYNGSAEELRIPEELDGKPVVLFKISGSGVKRVEIPNTITEIANGAFSECASLESVTIPDSIVRIGTGVFSGCTNLKRIEIPASVEKFGYTDGMHMSMVFDESGIEEVVISPDVQWEYFNGFQYCKKLKKINIPDGVELICDKTFEGCESLEEIVIPEGVKEIDTKAFSGCTSLKSVTLPESLTHIYVWVFTDCTSLTSLTLPDGIEVLGYDAFMGCKNLTVTYKGKEYGYEDFATLYEELN